MLFLIAGGDSRQLYLADKLAISHTVKIMGFDKYNSESDFIQADVLILPVITSTDSVHLNTPFASEKIKLESLVSKVKKEGSVFCGKLPEYIATVFNNAGIKIYNYSQFEPFVLKNALVTAEAALSTAMQNSNRTISSQKILVTGFGRISKSLVKILNGIGADVTVTSRNIIDSVWAEIYNFNYFQIDELSEYASKFDIIFNTVPALVFDSTVLDTLKNQTLIVDLASKPGGAVFNILVT